MNQNQWTAFKDITAGSVGGMFGTFLGQPADVVKTRMQTASLQNPLYTSNLHCIKEVVSKEGIRGFFKGITPPLLSSIPINAIIFPVQHIALNYISGSERKPNGIDLKFHALKHGTIENVIADRDRASLTKRKLFMEQVKS